MNNQSNIEAILQGCKRNDPRYQEQLYKTFYGYAFSICLRYSKNKDEAAEILNNSFLKVFEKIDQIAETRSFKGWLRKILIHSSIDYYRKFGKNESLWVSLEELQEQPVQNHNIGELCGEEILFAIQELPPSLNKVFNLYVFEGLKHKEIAEKINISESTSRANLANANKKLRKKLKGKAPLMALMFMTTGEFDQVFRDALLKYAPKYNPQHWHQLYGQVGQTAVPNTIVKKSSFLKSDGILSFKVILPLASLIVSLGVLYTFILESTENTSANVNIEFPQLEGIAPIESSNQVPAPQKVALNANANDTSAIQNKSAEEKQGNLYKSTFSNNSDRQLGGSPDDITERRNKEEFIVASPQGYATLQKVEATPIGGFNQLYQYFADSVRYPEFVKNNDMYGQVKVSFTIETNGTSTNVIITQGLHPKIDTEAIRLVENMPLWKPATMDNVPIKSTYIIPILFKGKKTIEH